MFLIESDSRSQEHALPGGRTLIEILSLIGFYFSLNLRTDFPMRQSGQARFL
jgi:hypothetical protein